MEQLGLLGSCVKLKTMYSMFGFKANCGSDANSIF